jgi:hypothetical protein
VTVADRPGFVSYIGPPEHDGLRQVNVYLPEGLAPGLERLVMSDGGRPMAAATIRLIPPGPAVPRVVSVSDGIDLLSGKRIVTGSVKASVEEVLHPEEFRALCNGSPVLDLEQFCTDPRLPCYEFNFKIPPEVVAGPARLSLFLGQRHLGEVEIEIVSVQ